jgi:hypothetical protein
MELPIELFKHGWTEIAQRRMSPHPVIESLDILEDRAPGLGAISKTAEVYTFSLKRPEERLGDGVIPTVAGSTYTHHNVQVSQKPLITVAGVLAAPIGMKSQSCWGTALKDCHAESALHQAFVLTGGHSPSYHATAEQIKDGSQIEPADVTSRSP